MENDPQSNPSERGETSVVFVSPIRPAAPSEKHPLSYWLKKFLVCNPFYLASAALLLYGVYLVSFDANFLSREISQLTFNFSALQIYEALLVGTAIILARRHIWYDSVLLITLENLLLLVPFMLISQATLLSQTAPLSQRIVLMICIAGAGTVLLRFWSLKHFFKDLNLPRRALVCGLLLLVVNVVLPLVFRHLHEAKVGTKPTEGAAYELNRYSWLLLVPAIVALTNLMPRARSSGDLLPQRRWLPLFLFVFWLAGSVTHIYSLSYVYNFDWEFVFIVPPLWAAFWSIYLRHRDFFSLPALSKLLMMPPLVIATLAQPRTEHWIFFALTVLNAASYLAIYLRQRRDVMAFHLLLLSCAILVGGLINLADRNLPLEITPAKWILACVTAYALYWIVRSRNPKTGIGGMLIVGIAMFNMVPRPELGIDLAIQSALVFLLLHSLRWVDADHAGARGARILAGVLLLLHGFVLVHGDIGGGNVRVLTAGGLLMGGYLLKRFLAGNWSSSVIPVVAGFLLLMPPGEFATDKLHSVSAGLLAVVGSFLLFGLGTFLALTKSRWNAPATNMPDAANPGTPR